MTFQFEMSAWKAAGISYVRFSAVAAGALKRGLNAEAVGQSSSESDRKLKTLFWPSVLAKRAGGSGQNIIARQWSNGKPAADFIIGNKVMEA